MAKETYLLFTAPVGISFGGLVEHETLIVYFFLLVVSYRNYRGPWMIKGIYSEAGTVRSFYME